MYPVLFTLFGYQITSFGIFLILGIITSMFVLWRLAQVYELDGEKVLDLFFLTALGSFIGARLFYIVTHLNQFDTITKMLFFFKYSGLSFWGAVLGGILVIRLMAPKLKLNFWQVADLGMVATFFMISMTSFGCLFGGCQYGRFYDGWFAVNQFGIAGPRFPLQLVEAGLFILGFIYLWHASLRFHYNGKIASLGLIILGVLKLSLEPLRGETQIGFLNMSMGAIGSLVGILLGITCFYKQSKRSFIQDLKFFFALFINSSKRKIVVSKTRRSWYNFVISTQISYQKWRKDMQRQLRIKSTPSKF
jgi:phosphatidylglycerol:prolipoprotein diacylglycerol transferase